MNIKLKTEISKEVKKDTVLFYITFSCIDETAKKALQNVTKDIDKCVEAYRTKLGLTNTQLIVSYVTVVENKVWKEVEYENPTTHIKDIKKDLVKDGYRSSGSIGIILPLTWADDTHKFSSIYIIADKCKYKTSIRYDYELKDTEKYMEELRSELLAQSKKEVLQIVGNIVYEKNLKIDTIFYNTSSDNSMPMYEATMCKSRESFGAEPQDEEMDLSILDNLISVENAPFEEISDSIEVVWTTYVEV